MFTYPGLFLLYAVLSCLACHDHELFGVVGIFSGGFMEMTAFNFIPLMRNACLLLTFGAPESDSSLASSSFLSFEVLS